MNTNDVAVATFDNHVDAEDAVKALQRSGFDMKRISIVGRCYVTEQHVVGSHADVLGGTGKARSRTGFFSN